MSDVSPFSKKVQYVNFISPRIRNSKYKVLSSGCCSPTLSCHRQLNLYRKFLHISLRENGSFELLSLHPSYGGALSLQVSNMVTRMVRHVDQEERERDGPYHWDTVRLVLLKVFGKQRAQIFTERFWIQFIQEGSSEKRVEYCVDHKNSLCYFRAIQGHSGSIPIMPELMGHTSIPYNWKEYIFHRGCSSSVQSILGSGLILGGKESDKARQAVFVTPLNPFGENADEEEPYDDYTVPQKVHHHRSGCRLLDKIVQGTKFGPALLAHKVT